MTTSPTFRFRIQLIDEEENVLDEETYYDPQRLETGIVWLKGQAEYRKQLAEDRQDPRWNEDTGRIEEEKNITGHY